jgi:hypothetical protein
MLTRNRPTVAKSEKTEVNGKKSVTEQLKTMSCVSGMNGMK